VPTYDFDRLTPAEQRELEWLLSVELRTSQYSPHEPTDRQRLFLNLPHLEAFYGGAAGGGKSDALLMGALEWADTPGYAALLLRRTFQDLAKPGALLDRSYQWLSQSSARWNDQKKQWKFHGGSIVAFGYLQNESDVYQYQSAEYQYIGFDELTQFTETQYKYLFSRLRRLRGSNVPLRMRSASNPGGIGAEWVQKRFIPDDWAPEDAAELQCFEKDGAAFVPARMDDNPHLDQSEYEKSLELLDPVTRAQLRLGDWRIRPKGNIYKAWSDGVDGHHVITWSQFAAIFGEKAIPDHWLGACAQDWGFDPDPCATVWAFVAGENSPRVHGLPLAGSIFIPVILTCRGEIPDDVADKIRMIEADHQWASRIQYRVMSHEASSQQATYRRKAGLHFLKWQPDVIGGIGQVQHYLKVRHSERPHPFKPQVMGRPKLYLIVPDDQMENPKGDEGLSLLRAEFRQYKWVDQVVTDRNGSNRIIPYDFFNHYMDAVRGMAAKWFTTAAGLTEFEQVEAALPTGLRVENGPQSSEDWKREGWELARHIKVAEVKKTIEQKRGRDLDDSWNPASPLENVAEQSPWDSWER